MTMNALDELLSRHDRECGVNVYISEPYECTCGRAEAAYELAELRAVVEAARGLLRAVDGFGPVGSVYEKRNELAAVLARVEGEK